MPVGQRIDRVEHRLPLRDAQASETSYLVVRLRCVASIPDRLQCALSNIDQVDRTIRYFMSSRDKTHVDRRPSSWI